MKSSKFSRLLTFFIISSAITTPLRTISREAKDNALSVGASGAIIFCTPTSKAGCENILPSGDLKKAIDDGYEHLSIVNIYKDGDLKVVATSFGGCSTFFSFNQLTRAFSTLYFQGNGKDICNYKIEKNHLISSYKLDSKQYEDVYELRNGAYWLVLSDGCVGCDQVTRSIYQDGRLSSELLVTNRKNYSQRRPVTSSVATDKAWLYSAPSNASKNKIYLVKGDVVQLLKFNDADGLWYFAKYLSKGNGAVLKWVKCEDLVICKRSLAS